jgi:hypothetical protein
MLLRLLVEKRNLPSLGLLYRLHCLYRAHLEHIVFACIRMGDAEVLRRLLRSILCFTVAHMHW